MTERSRQPTNAELEEKIRLLTLENDHLAERAEDTMLLGLMAEKINHITDVDLLISTGLEQIALLKNIPFAACFTLEDGLALPLHSYSPSQEQNPVPESVPVSPDIAQSLTDGVCILKGEELARFNCFGFQKSGNAILLPLGNQHGPRLLFVFANEDDDDPLSPLHYLLLQVVDMIAGRIDNIELVGQLSLANQDLDQKVNDRTRELLASEDRVRTLFESAFDAFIVVDYDTNFRYVNQEACRNLGYSRDEMMKMKIKHVDVETDRETALSILDGIRNGALYTHESVFKRKDGSTYPVEIRVGPIEIDDDDLFLAQIRDVSERNRLLEQLNQAQKMEAVGRLAGGIAHDFNNILTALMGHVDLLKMELPEDKFMDEEVDLIRGTIDKAATLTHQLLAFSRKQVMDMKTFDLANNIQNMSRMLLRMVTENIELKMDLPSSAAFIFGDPGRIEQILLNLVINAKDAMPNGGQLLISTKRVEREDSFLDPHPHGPRSTGKYLVLKVEDTGEGIDPDTLSKIFDPFFTTKDVGKGTGLGLAMVYGLAQQHHARVKVRSELGQGTVFEIAFPEVVAVDALPSAPGPDSTTGGHETVLLVEDDRAIRGVLTRMIERLGYQLITAHDGENALTIAAEFKEEIQLVLTDVIMPKMGGGDLVQALKKIRPQIKVIYMSGYTDDAVGQAELSQPDTHFLQKPVSMGQLAAILRDALD